jgi:WD40 repeat protein/flagellar biosynthesis GTPase FlhF
MAFRSLFNDDIFISYSREDGGDYVGRLDNQLTEKGYSCFADHKGTESGEEPPSTLYAKIRACKTFVLVASPMAVARSKYIAREVEEFADSNGTLRIVPISFDSGEQLAVWKDADWWKRVEGKRRLRESHAALKTGVPSAEVVNRIIEISNYAKNKDRLRRYRDGALATFLILLAASGVLLGYGRKWVNDARAANALAQDVERKAAERISNAQARVIEAEAKFEQANALAVAANEKRIDAEKATARANEATKAAEEKRTVAERKTEEAEALRKTAEAEARKQQGVAASREKASESTQLLRGGVGRIREAVKTAEESVRLAAEVGAATTESYMAMRSSVAMLPALRVRRPLDRAVSSAFSPDGGTVAVAGPDQTLRLFKVDDLQKESAPSKPLTVKSGNLFAVSDGGKLLALATSNHVRIFDSEKTVCEFDVKNQNLIDNPGNSQGQDVISAIALSPDGKYVAVAANHKTGDEIDAPDETRDFQGVVTFWYVDRELKKATKIAILGDDFNRLADIAFGPDGDVLAVGGERAAILWDLSNVRTRREQFKRKQLENDLKAQGMEEMLPQTKPQSPNEYEGATSIDFDLIRVVVPQNHDVTKVAPGRSVSRFASAAGDNVTIWQRAAIGAYEPSAYLPLSRNVGKLAFDYDDETLSIVDAANQTGTGVVYEVWDTTIDSTKATVESDGEFLSLWFTDQNAIFAEKYTNTDQDERTLGLIWPTQKKDDDQSNLRLRAYSSEWGTSLARGKYVLASDDKGRYYIYSVLNQQKKFSLPATFGNSQDNIYGDKLSSDDASVVLVLPATSSGEEVNLFTLEGDRYVQRESFKVSNRTVCVSHDGSAIAYRNLQGKLILKSPKGGSRVFLTLGNKDSVTSLEFSPEGTYLVLSSTGKQGDRNKYSATVYRTTDGVRMGEILTDDVNDQTFSADDKFIAMGGDNGVVQVVEIANWKIQSFTQSNPVYKIAFNPQADAIATISTERNACTLTRNDAPESIVTIFDRKGGSESARLFQKGCVSWLSFSRDGTYLATSAELETRREPLYRVTIWNLGVDDLVEEAQSRLKCMSGGAGTECGNGH